MLYNNHIENKCMIILASSNPLQQSYKKQVHDYNCKFKPTSKISIHGIATAYKYHFKIMDLGIQPQHNKEMEVDKARWQIQEALGRQKFPHKPCIQ